MHVATCLYTAPTRRSANPHCSRPGEQGECPIEWAIVAINMHLVKQQVIPDVALRTSSVSERWATRLPQSAAWRTGWAWMQHQMPA